MIQGSTLLAAGSPLVHVVSHKLFAIGPFAFTNHMLMELIVGAILVVVFSWMARNYPMAPTGVRMLLETGLQVVREGIARPVLRDRTDRYIPFVWTLFFFILINNLIGLIPLSAVAGITAGQPELFGTATANLSVTAALAAMVFVTTHVVGVLEEIRHQRHRGRSPLVAAAAGFLLYWYHIVPLVPGVMGVLLFPILFVLEMIGALVKPFALAMRLFANIMAGHLLLAALTLMIPVIKGISTGGVALTVVLGCTALGCLELFVAFLQAYVFTFLSCMYIGAAVSPEH